LSQDDLLAAKTAIEVGKRTVEYAPKSVVISGCNTATNETPYR